MPDSFEGINFTEDKIIESIDRVLYPLPDLTYLKEMAGGDEVFVDEIISYFIKFGPDSLLTMRESALSGDYEKLRFCAHTLLPQLTFVGILAAIPYVEKIERDYKLIDKLFNELDAAIKIISYGIEDLKNMI